MNQLLTDRVVLVSGGTRGLGAAIARAAAREGAVVAVTGRRKEPGDALAAELTAAGNKARFIQADAADTAQARACAAAVVTEFGRVDSLVNVAGITDRGTLLDTTPELFDEIADFVVFLLSDRSGVVTGSLIDWDQNVLGGMD